MIKHGFSPEHGFGVAAVLPFVLPLCSSASDRLLCGYNCHSYTLLWLRLCSALYGCILLPPPRLRQKRRCERRAYYGFTHTTQDARGRDDAIARGPHVEYPAMLTYRYAKVRV